MIQSLYIPRFKGNCLLFQFHIKGRHTECILKSIHRRCFSAYFGIHVKQIPSRVYFSTSSIVLFEADWAPLSLTMLNFSKVSLDFTRAENLLVYKHCCFNLKPSGLAGLFFKSTPLPRVTLELPVTWCYLFHNVQINIILQEVVYYQPKCIKTFNGCHKHIECSMPCINSKLT